MIETSHHGTPFGNIRLRYWPAAGASGEAGSRGGNKAESKAEAWPTVVLIIFVSPIRQNGRNEKSGFFIRI